MNWINISDRATNGGGITHLSDEQVQKIHAASLEILEGIGVRLHLSEAIDLLKQAGERVSDGNLVHVPPKLVENALVRSVLLGIQTVNHDFEESSRVNNLEG